jgi:hypothetical protein
MYIYQCRHVYFSVSSYNNSYESGYIDYYVCVMNQPIGESGNTETWVNARDEL